MALRYNNAKAMHDAKPTVKNLKEELRKAGLAEDGLRPVLLQRLAAHLDALAPEQELEEEAGGGGLQDAPVAPAPAVEPAAGAAVVNIPTAALAMQPAAAATAAAAASHAAPVAAPTSRVARLEKLAAELLDYNKGEVDEVLASYGIVGPTPQPRARTAPQARAWEVEDNETGGLTLIRKDDTKFGLLRASWGNFIPPTLTSTVAIYAALKNVEPSLVRMADLSPSQMEGLTTLAWGAATDKGLLLGHIFSRADGPPVKLVDQNSSTAAQSWGLLAVRRPPRAAAASQLAPVSESVGRCFRHPGYYKRARHGRREPPVLARYGGGLAPFAGPS